MLLLPVHDEIASNRRRAAALLAGVVAVVVLLGLLLGLLVGQPLALAVAAVIGVVLAAAAWRAGEDMVLRAIGAQSTGPTDQPRLHNLVEGLCAGAGLPKPRLLVVADDAPDALAVGRGPRHASVVCTSGLLSHLSRIELEGVLAHELSHIRADDVAVATLAAVVVAPVSPSLAARVSGADREAAADARAVSITRYPPGLLAALEKIDAAGGRANRSRLAGHLWIGGNVAAPRHARMHALQEL